MASSANEKQIQFFKSKTRFVAYGGSRGGGKSWAVRKKAQFMCVTYPGIRILIMRRTFPELRENHILPLLVDLQVAATYRDTDKAFTFLNGSRLRFGYCDSETDVLQYQGQEYDVIFIDEATQFTEFQFSTLTACLRGANTFPKRFYLTCNPGGVGHEWVKRLFIDRQYTDKENPEEYTFIRAGVRDNKALMESDTGYVSMLENLPDNLRKAWLDGDWDIFEGQYFSEFSRDIHVCKPFEIPAHWRRYIALDYGLDMLAAYNIAVDEQSRAYVTSEIYEPNVIISDAAQRLKAWDKPYIYLAPPDLWNRRQETGRSVADIFAEQGVYLVKSSNDRVDGWMAVKEWLKPFEDVDGATRAKLAIFENCTNLIRCIPALQYDQKNPNDVSTQPHEITHAPDALRYFCVYWTSSAEVPRGDKAKWKADWYEDWEHATDEEREMLIKRRGNPF